MGLAREVSMLKQVFCCLILLSVVLSPVVLQWSVTLIFLSKINYGLTEMPSSAEQAIHCPSTGTSACPHFPHGTHPQTHLAHRELHKIYVRSYTEVVIV